MTRRLSLLTLAAAVLGALLLAVAVQAALRSAPPAKKRSTTVSVLDRSQTRLAVRGRVPLVVRHARPGRHRVVVSLAGLRPATRTVKVGRRAKRFSVRLGPAARERLRTCRGARLTVSVVRAGRRVARTRRALSAVPPCAAAREASAATASSERNPNAAAKPADKPKDDKPPKGSDPVAPGFDTSTFDRCDALDPAVCMQPFPSNHLTKADASTETGRRVNFHRDSMPKNRAGKPIEPSDYNHSDGFPPGTSIVTRVPGLDNIEAFRQTGAVPIDDPARSLQADAPIQVIDAETGEPHLVWSEIDSNPPTDAERNLIIRPAKHFVEGRRYVVVLRNLRDRSGTPIEAQRPFAVYRDRIETTDAKVEGRRETMERDVFAPLERAGIDRKELYLAWDFTVASAKSTTGRMLSIRDRAFAELGDTNLADRQIQGSSPLYSVNPDLPDDAPALDDAPKQLDGIVDYESGPIRRKIRGTIAVPCYLNAPGCPPGSQFQIGPDGLPLQIPQNRAVYEWTCNIPRAKAGEPADTTFRPLLYGHGLLGQHEEIDWGGNPDFAREHGFIFCGVDWNGMAFKDLPNVATILQDLSRFPTLADGVQQGFLGFLYLGRALMHPDGMGAHDAFMGAVDRTELFYDGNSQGGIYGGSLLAIAPDHERAVLGVPGMNYSTLLHRSVDFDGYAEGEFVDGQDSEFGMYDNYPSHLERPLLFGIVQMVWDRADPSGYAAHMTDDPLPNTPTHKALLQVGFGDHQVADVTTEVEARTIGAAVHRPGLAPGRARYSDRPYPDAPEPEFFQGVPGLGDPGYASDGSGVVFWDIAPKRALPPPPAANIPPREGDDPHENVRRDAKAQRQKSEFLKPDGRIVDVCGGPCLVD